MIGCMQEVVRYIAQFFFLVLLVFFLVLRAGIAGLLCVRVIDRLGKIDAAVMLEGMGYPLGIKTASPDTGHQHDQ